VARIVVTGGSGFLGSHLCDALLQRGDEVVAVDDLSTGRLQNLAHLAEHRAFAFVRADVSKELPVDGPVDGVLHFASPASPPEYLATPLESLDVSSLGTRRALDLALAGNARFLLASTSEIYGDPDVHPQPEEYNGNVDPTGPRAVYDEAKRVAETLTSTYRRLYDLPTAIVRIFNTYGPRLRPSDGRVVSNFLMQAIDGKPLTVYGTGNQTRSFCNVTDEVRGIVALFDSTCRIRSTSATRTRSRCSSWSTSCAGSPTPNPTSCSNRCQWAIRLVVAPTSRARRNCSAGNPWSSCARVWRRCATGTKRSETMAGRDDVVPAKLRKLSVVVPVYNERNTLVEVLRRMRAVELPDGIEKEIIVVDDGSTDGTRDVLRQLGDSTVRIVMLDKNQGKGAALRAGFGHATGEFVLVQDADLEYDPEDWPKLLNPVLRGRARVVYGSRFTGERRNMLLLHWIGNRFLSMTTNVLYNTTLSDMETCYKLIERTLVEEMKLTSNRFDIEAEMSAKILKRRIRIYEVPISYSGREFDEGKKITWRDGFSALYTLVKYRFRD